MNWSRLVKCKYMYERTPVQQILLDKTMVFFFFYTLVSFNSFDDWPLVGKIFIRSSVCWKNKIMKKIGSEQILEQEILN